MAQSKASQSDDDEIEAISAVNGALKNLDADAQARVVTYIVRKLGISELGTSTQTIRTARNEAPSLPEVSEAELPPIEEKAGGDNDEFDGINSVALKWIRRSQLTAADLSKIFSIGLDEIDLVAAKVPGANKKERMHSVLLLKSIAAYLASGAARVAHETVKEACLHYDAWDTNNFASYLKSFASEVGGNKESGYTLTPKGLTVATELVRTAISLQTTK